ncbi:hypothetical protein GCM10023310_26500 [Paenibacillus vulneris]
MTALTFYTLIVWKLGRKTFHFFVQNVIFFVLSISAIPKKGESNENDKARHDWQRPCK